MKTTFTIGEMSKIHNVPVKTLRYYDEIDLFKPFKVDEHNGYRYYSYTQFETLNTIMFLKVLGVSLSEIKDYMAIRSKSAYTELLKKEKMVVQDKIKALKKLDLYIDRQLEEVEATEHLPLENEVVIKSLPERSIILLNDSISNTLELEFSLHKLKGLISHTVPLIIGKVGLSMNHMDIMKGKFTEYSAIFIFNEEHIQSDLTTCLSEGLYACVYYNGHDHKNAPEYYKKIVEFIHKNNYKITGDAVERVMINEYKSNNPKEYLTEIQIPIEK